MYYVSHSLLPTELRYPNLEKLALALLVSSCKLSPYFQAHLIIIFTNHPLRQVLYRPKISRRLMRWSIELSKCKIRYLPRATIKGQVVADFIAELTLGKEAKTQPVPNFPTSTPLEALHSALTWELYMEGSSNNDESGASLVLSLPELEHIRREHALRLKLKASNNEAEYEALLASLRLAQVVRARHLSIFSNSQLVVRQIS